MADEITVVKVTREGERSFFVEFSHPVVHPAYLDQSAYTSWFASDENDDLIEGLDELGAFQWGLEVIKKHKEMQHAQDA